MEVCPGLERSIRRRRTTLGIQNGVDSSPKAELIIGISFHGQWLTWAIIGTRSIFEDTISWIIHTALLHNELRRAVFTDKFY